MDYVELNITTTSAEQIDILTAELAEFPFESFTNEGETLLKGYIPQERLVDCKETVDNMLREYGIEGHRYISIETQNWNSVWESHFDRVEVGDKLLIRAPFHDADSSFAREVIIMPKMSFGTGHHATTYLMSEMIMKLGEADALRDAEVLDLGSGTGVLAIIAAQEGAASIDAVDIDEWAYENCIENIAANGVVGRVKAMLGDSSAVQGNKYDVVLANINRNILIANMPSFAQMLPSGGVLLMSGFLEHDVEAIAAKGAELGFQFAESNVRDGWVVMQMNKI